MRKATAIYHAPEGGNKVCEWADVTFFDGQPVELNSVDHAHMMSKLPGNPHFDFELGEEIPDALKPKRGRPSNADIKANMAAATAHDFEKDRQDEIARRDALS